jgi:hypothetical protein
MDSVVNYLEDTEKKLVKEMAELFSKMREQRDTMSLTGIEDMYNIEPVEGVLYDPCVRIPGHGGYYCSEYKLPKDEYVIIVRTGNERYNIHPHNPVYSCVALTNYGRVFRTQPIFDNRGFCGNSYHSPANDSQIHCVTNGESRQILPIIKLEPLSYKMPEFIIRAYKFGMGMASPAYDVQSHGIPDSSSLQELNKEFYLFAGKWKPHMTKHATLDIDTMRQTIIENTASIQELTEKNKTLEEKNIALKAELKELKEQKDKLEKERNTLLPLQKYKEAVLEFMHGHYNADKRWFSKMDSSVIEFFKAFHSDKVFMNKWEYNNLMESKEELNEYRIYKKVKGEMVSNGMDNSSVARLLKRV